MSEQRRSVSPWAVVLIVVAAVTAVAGLAAAVWAFTRWLRPKLVSVPSVDLDRLAGSWHAIAALPAAERDTAPGEALRILHEGGGALRINRLTRSRKGKKTREVLAMATESGTRLRLSAGGGLGRELRVLSLTPSYDAVLIGSPDRRRAWMLARSKAIPRATWRHFRDELARQGYATQRLRQAPGTRVRLDEGLTLTPDEAAGSEAPGPAGDAARS